MENLDLRRAALLLPDYDEDLFVPWASNGLDATSLHRLRIPVEDLNAAIDQSETGLVWIGDNSRDFAPYFSRREATMLDNLLVFPFVFDGDLQSVLIITDTPYFDDHTEYLRIILAAVGEPAARVIQEKRLAFSRLMRQSIVFKRSEIGIVAERVAEKASNGITAVLLQLADIVSQVATANEYLDPYRVWQDVLRITTALFASTASVCDADEHRALLLLHGAVGDDRELVIHHVAATIADFLPELSTIPVLRFSSARYPDDGNDIGALIDALL